MGAVERQPEQPLCIHFINSVALHATRKHDRFSSFNGFIDWAASAGLLPKSDVARWNRWGAAHRSESKRLLGDAVNFREYLYNLFVGSAGAGRIAPSKLVELNKMLAAPGVHRKLELADEGVIATWDCGDGLSGMLRKIALSAADVLLDESWRKIICCDRDACDWLAIDTSKNHSRRYCSSAGCGNFARVQRHYHRQHAGAAKVRPRAIAQA